MTKFKAILGTIGFGITITSPIWIWWVGPKISPFIANWISACALAVGSFCAPIVVWALPFIVIPFWILVGFRFLPDAWKTVRSYRPWN